jgi:acetate kinase
MNGVDVIVMTAGMGENDNLIRNGILTNMEYLGIEIDEKFNLELPRSTQAELSTPNSKVKVWVVPTDEELMIAKDTQILANKFYGKI